MKRLSRRLAASVACALIALMPPSLSAASLRIVTLSPHAAELVVAAGASDCLVGVAAFTDRLPGAAALPVIGDVRGLDRERVIALQPDLAVAWQGGNRQADLDWLASRGIPVFASDPLQLDDIPREVRALARLIGTAATGETVAQRLEQQLARLREDFAQTTPVSYFFQLWPEPPMTFGGRALITRGLAECGGVNVFSTVPRESFAPDPESLRRIVPAVEIIPSDLGESAPLTSASRTVHVVTDGLYRPGPRFVEALDALCLLLHDPGAP